MDDLDETELQNPFPSPPSLYTHYTTHNLNLLELLRKRCDDIHVIDFEQQSKLLEDQKDVPDFPLVHLEKPRVDWIVDDTDGYYDVFGDRWFVKDKIPSLAEAGGTQLYPVDPTVDRRPALKSILQSLLTTYSSLTKSLLDPPPANLTEEAPEWQRHLEWLTVLSQNLLAAANDLRPVQVCIVTLGETLGVLTYCSGERKP
jgi:mediator of RNA polymerase II transcription subunit 7